MRHDLLTIIIPTRDRPELLAMCLRSLFESQSFVPPVVVSDNSTREHPGIQSLKSRYGFLYVRRSGSLSLVEHLNVCLQMATSRWVLELHDDDELCTGALDRLREFLDTAPEVGIVMGGTDAIDVAGHVIHRWVPSTSFICRGDAALLALGLDWGLRAPGTVYGVDESRRLGGFPDILRNAADYALGMALAYHFGVSFFPERLGRQREWHGRATEFDTSSKAQQWLAFTGQQAAFVRTLGGAPDVAERLADYLTWTTFESLEPCWRTFARKDQLQLVQTCLKYSPGRGEMQIRLRRQYPFLFWQPRWLPEPLRALGRLMLSCLPGGVRRALVNALARILV